MTPLRTLILNGSPRPDGDSMALAAAFQDALGGDCRRVDLYRVGLGPCVDCGACRGGAPCPLPDALPDVLDALAAADVVAAASPLHFSSLSAPLVAFFSRLQPFWRGARLPLRDRRAVLAVAAGSRYPDMFRPARAVAAAAFKTLGIPFAGMVACPETDRTPAGDNPDAMAEARLLGRRVAAALRADVQQ